MTQVAIIIVTHNSRAEISNCLQSARQANAEILVIDNASEDGTGEAVAELGVALIANAANRGFAGAVNQGVRATTAPLLLLLNPDAILQTGIEALVTQCEDIRVGVTSGQLQCPRGVPQAGFNVRRFPTPMTLFFETVSLNYLFPANPVNWRYRCLDYDLGHASEVEQPAGAFLMFRRDVWEKTGGFDEGFFPIWFEDVDFCKRVKDAGYSVFYRPESIALHCGGHSIASLEPGTRATYWYRGLLRYSIRHFRPAGKILVGLGVVTGSLLRLVFGGSSHRNRAMLRIYGLVVKLAFRSMWIRKVQFGEIVY